MPHVNKEKNREYQRKHYRENKQYHYDKNEERRKRVEAWFIDYKNKLKCERCSENHIACLDFHHNDPNKKDFNIGRAVASGKGIKRLQLEISKCSVLCANCHRKLHYNEKQCLGGVMAAAPSLEVGG